jgi:hypothetical protein
MATEVQAKPARMTVEGAKVPRSARLVVYSAVRAARGNLQAIREHRMRTPSPARVPCPARREEPPADIARGVPG